MRLDAVDAAPAITSRFSPKVVPLKCRWTPCLSLNQKGINTVNSARASFLSSIAIMAQQENFDWDFYAAEIQSFMLPPTEEPTTLEPNATEVLDWEQIASLNAVLNAPHIPSPTEEPFNFDNHPHTSPVGEHVTINDLDAQVQLVMQKLQEQAQDIDKVKAEVEQSTKTVNGLAVMNSNAIVINEQNALRVENLKAVYDQFAPWTLEMYKAIQEMARREGLVVDAA
ncbi:hypothetical protein V501_00014 [Pseudogymnoascus sp. VKM F-4519 (FW-2642)]|nr:hypothetical protein V501_00014 [Pseudogymnoascus sp. VKM F-4519 (FW-2642)]